MRAQQTERTDRRWSQTTEWEPEVRAVAAEASAAGSLAPGATKGVEGVAPDQLEGT